MGHGLKFLLCLIIWALIKSLFCLSTSPYEIDKQQLYRQRYCYSIVIVPIDKARAQSNSQAVLDHFIPLQSLYRGLVARSVTVLGWIIVRTDSLGLWIHFMAVGQSCGMWLECVRRLNLCQGR